MNCTWCEEEGELIDYCDIEGHRVCKECYEKYKMSYPLRVEGCPYCKGNEEKVVVYIHSEDDAVAEVARGAVSNAIDSRNTHVVYYVNDYVNDGCCERMASLVIIATIVVGLMLYSVTTLHF